MTPTAMPADAHSQGNIPTLEIDTSRVFGFACPFPVRAFVQRNEHVPEIDHAFRFDRATTLAVLAGFALNRRVLLQGLHGTGKTSHIEQVAARLNWPCMRVNLDGHVSRVDLIGKDAIAIRDGKQVTEFREGILPWSLRRPVALVLDEYDAGRPDVMFVLQRLLESDGALTLLDQNTVVRPHASFRLFATANTLGLGDSTGLYHGTQLINQGQLDRWHIVAAVNYPSAAIEESIVLRKVPALDTAAGRECVARMVALAGFVRAAFAAGDLSTVMSPRGVIIWAENLQIFGSAREAFRLTFFNRCDEAERALIAELYQRCFDEELCIDGSQQPQD
jgi:cobaltochelatase CobS